VSLLASAFYNGFWYRSVASWVHFGTPRHPSPHDPLHSSPFYIKGLRPTAKLGNPPKQVDWLKDRTLTSKVWLWPWIPTMINRRTNLGLTRGGWRLHKTHCLGYHWNSASRRHGTRNFRMLHPRWRCTPAPPKHRQLLCHSNQSQLNISAQEPPDPVRQCFPQCASRLSEAHTLTHASITHLITIPERTLYRFFIHIFMSFTYFLFTFLCHSHVFHSHFYVIIMFSIHIFMSFTYFPFIFLHSHFNVVHIFAIYIFMSFTYHAYFLFTFIFRSSHIYSSISSLNTLSLHLYIAHEITFSVHIF